MKKSQIIYLLYLSLSTLAIGILLATPFLISDGVSIFSEEQVEVGILAAMILIFFVVDRTYRSQIKRYAETITDVTRHVAVLNRQVSGLESVFSIIRETPTSKPETHKLLIAVGNGLLNTVNAKWILIRVIATAKQRTMAEALVVRGGDKIAAPSISNKQLIAQNFENHTLCFVDSGGEAFRVYGVMPEQKISSYQKRIISIAIDAVSVVLAGSDLYNTMTSNATNMPMNESNISPAKKL